ncbi:flavin reductase family protein [Actinokineospora sp. UTMC 2448]|uniref:flavin reductase family protein n=1 Tax=Actinokineospora sp. UTMC 2448 TaxID=2268449 RepID=UPI0021648A31|nr:flavin reductase family protein [Actinokineospora sp. UTMC 2448]UVS78735.1 NADH:FMN oxidoreductase [Actinokineospora sp. UTMC 2448]
MTARVLAEQAVASVFPDAMARLAAGLAVVTTRDAEAPRGLLVSSLCSYSVAPPSVLLTIDRGSRSYRPLTEGAEFGVHLLADTQAAVAERFARRGADKFAGLAWEWDGGVPRLRGVPVYLRCALARVFAHGDHAVVIGEVAAARVGRGDPLVYFGRRYDWRLRGPA